MVQITSKHSIRQVVHQGDRFRVTKIAVLENMRRDFEVYFKVNDRIWLKPDDSKLDPGPVVALCRSGEEALNYIKGAEEGAFVTIPHPDQFEIFNGLEERVKQGA